MERDDVYDHLADRGVTLISPVAGKIIAGLDIEAKYSLSSGSS
jgi:hypothetical protein